MEQSKSIFKNKKVMIIAGSIVGVLLAIGIVLVVLMLTIWAKPSKTDFQTAATDAEKIADTKVSPLFQTYLDATEADADKGSTYDKIISDAKGDRQKVESALASRQKGSMKLKESRALRDESIKKTYDVYLAKENQFRQYVTNYLDTYPVFQSAGVTCIDIFSVARQATTNDTFAPLHKKAAEDCLVDLDRLSKSKIDAFADYGKEFTRIVKARQDLFDKLAAGTVTEADVSRGLRTLGKDVANNDPNEALRAYVKKSSFNGELNALIAALKKKANETK